MPTAYPFSRPLYIMTKPAGAACNMQCTYCYYLEKSKLYNRGQKHIMSDLLTERFVREYIQSQTTPEVLFTWHGGEPLLRGIEYYRQVVRWQNQYAGGRSIVNCIQTNGTMLNAEWCQFLHDNNWLVGVSIDGPREMHDCYRRMGSSSSWEAVMKGIELLNRYQVEWNAMAVVNNVTAQDPLGFYHFFRDTLQCQYLQFTPVVERYSRHDDGRQLAHLFDTEKEIAPFSVKPKDWGDFLCTIFNEWVRQDVGKMFVQIFDATLANWMGVVPGVCTLSDWCGHAAVMEHNGDVYCCDHFVFPEFKLGNIHNNSLLEMLYGEKQNQFGAIKTQALPRQCRECRWQFACHGECPRNRFLKTADGESGLNYLCSGYQMFFGMAAPYMDIMKRELQANRPAANVMKFL